MQERFTREGQASVLQLGTFDQRRVAGLPCLEQCASVCKDEDASPTWDSRLNRLIHAWMHGFQ
jgi:hypothetical protein